MDDTSKTPELRRVTSSGQRDLFDHAASQTTSRITRGFVDPDPTSLFVGDHRLHDFLVAVGMTVPLLVRTLIRELDLTKFEESYTLTGRAPYHPAVMLGLIMYGVMRGHSSLRDLEEMAKLDLGSHWLSGGVFPDHSTFGLFINRHAALITEDFFEQLTALILERVGGPSQVLSGDGTVIEAAANRYKTLKLEAARAQYEELAAEDVAEVDEEDTSPSADDEMPGGQDGGEPTTDHADAEGTSNDAVGSTFAPSDETTSRTNVKDVDAQTGSAEGGSASSEDEQTRRKHLLKRAIEVGEERAARRATRGASEADTPVVLTDPEAGVVKDKRGKIVPGYIPSVIASGRFIIALAVSGASETQVLPDLFAQAKRVSGLDTAVLLMDSNYHSISAAKTAAAENLLLVSPAGEQLRPSVPKNLSKTQHFAYSFLTNSYECLNGVMLEYKLDKHDKRRGTTAHIYRASSSDCGGCWLKPECTSARRREISRSTEEHYLEELRATFEEPWARQLYGQRMATVEPVFAEIKGVQGLTRFHRRGAVGVAVEFAIHGAAHNIRRLVAHLKRWGKRVDGASWDPFCVLRVVFSAIYGSLLVWTHQIRRAAAVRQCPTA